MQENIKIYLHPDALYDMPYEEHILPAHEYTVREFDFSACTKDKKGITVNAGGGNFLRIDALADNLVRVRFGFGELTRSLVEKYGIIKQNFEGAPFTYTADKNAVTFSTDKIDFTFCPECNEFKFTDKEGNILLETKKGGVKYSDEAPDFGSGKRFLANFVLPEEEHVFGFGGRTMPPDRTHTTVDIFTEKVGALLGDYGGCPVPYYISTKGYGMYLNNPWPHLYFDMAKTYENEWFVNAPGGEFDMFFFTGDDFDSIVGTYTDITGRVPARDKATIGFWCSSINFEEDKEVIDVAERLHKEGYPCDAVVIDGPWRGGKAFLRSYSLDGQYPTNDMDWHPDFGDGPGMIDHLLKQNIKTVLHINSRNFLPKTFIPAVEKGLLRQQEEEFVANFATEEAREYYKNLIKPRIRENLWMWWTDHADRISGEIDKNVPSRNLFGVLWNRLCVQAMEEEGKKNGMCLTRGSGVGGQKYGCPWPGDTKVGVDRFGEDVWYCLNAGLAGFAYTSCDLGGFYSPWEKDVPYDINIDPAFDEENICRRVLQSIMFIPVPRLHNNQSTIAKLPWRCPEQTLPLYKAVLNWRYEMAPYFYSAGLKASKTGEPIIKPMVYYNIKDEKTYGINDQLYVGESIIMAPVFTEGAREREVYLPAGEWINMWTGEEVKGCQTIMAPAPLYEIEGLPTFVKKGAIIAKQPFALTLTDDIVPTLTLDVYKAESGSVTLWEGEDISNTFSYDGNVFTLENNTEIDRTYIINIIGGKKVEVLVPANTTKVISI